jgi:tryptophan synthase beta chain
LEVDHYTTRLDNNLSFLNIGINFMSDQNKILLEEREMPTQWYNILADLPAPMPPPLHPGTHEPATAEDFGPLFPMALIEQEMTGDRYVDIPGEVLDVYKLWRPTPLFRARRLERQLDTPAKIFYKYEGVSPAGSHKPNTAVPQAYYNAKEGVSKLTTETGAGQWGSALAFACSQFGLECEVWMVAASYHSKPSRRTMMEVWGGKVHPSPSSVTEYGRSLLKDDPDHPGSLGIAISEAVSEAVADERTRYALGSVLNHVLMHQTIIGEETLLQLAKVGETPDILIGCTGGGSNFGGLSFPFLREKLAGNMNPIIRCVEPSACPTLTKGEYRYDFGDTAGLTPLMKMHTLGHNFIPEPIHAGGLRYHGMSPLVSHIYELGLVEAISIPQKECFEVGVLFAKSEGIVPAPEPTHAIAAAVREAIACRESGEEKTILTALCGHGHLDLPSYEKFLSGDMVDLDLDQSVIDEALSSVPTIES